LKLSSTSPAAKPMAAAQGNLADLQIDSLKIDDFQLQLSDMKRDEKRWLYTQRAIILATREGNSH
jgi:hypothetical protein